MVFDTSCWATESVMGNGHQLLASRENPVQRRTKIDYFNHAEVINVSPIVSTLSSNGYYGYCPTPTTSSFVHCDIESRESPIVEHNITMDEAMAATAQNNGSFRQHCVAERRKRSIQDDPVPSPKRSRNQFDCIEGSLCVFMLSYI